MTHQVDISQNQVPNLVGRIKLDSQEKYETVVIPQIDNVFDATIGQAIKQKAKPINNFYARYYSRQTIGNHPKLCYTKTCTTKSNAYSPIIPNV